MNDALKDIQDARKEASKNYGLFLENAERDQKVALGDAWAEADKEKLTKEGRPVLNINLVGKGCRVISAQQRQNPMDLAFYPVEGTDQQGADVYAAVTKWLFANGRYNVSRNLAFDDTVQAGIGWLSPCINYDYEPLYGDIELNHESIYSILPDPYLTKMDLEDCDYIVRQKYLSKQKIITLWPEHEKDIKAMSGSTSVSEYKTVIADENKLFVSERWYRTYEKSVIIFNSETLEFMRIQGAKKDVQAQLALRPELEIVERRMPVMKLQIGINDTLLVYDGLAPEGYSSMKYPFIPLWGFYTPHYNEQQWDLRLHGYARWLIDSQIEKNKTRSILMDGMMKAIRNTVAAEEGVFKNPEAINSNRGEILTINPGGWDKWKHLDPPRIDMAMVQLEQMHSQDMKEEGLNPDLLQIEGGSAASAPTSSLQLRREQGMMSVQQLFDNLGLANRMLGLYLIDLINTWPRQKIEKIIEGEVPEDWDKRKYETRYDCIVDEKSSSPTYRKSVYNEALQLAQHGQLQIPPQVTRKLIDFPADIRKEWDAFEQQQQQQAQQQQQQAMQLQQAQQQLQQAQLQIEMQKEQMKQQGETMRLQIEEQGKDKRLIMELTNDLAIAKTRVKNKK